MQSSLSFYKSKLLELKYANKQTQQQILASMDQDPTTASQTNDSFHTQVEEFNTESNPNLFIYTKENTGSHQKKEEEKYIRIKKL